MKAITIRNLPDIVADAIQTKAKDEHLSISKALISLLQAHVMEDQKNKNRKKRDLTWMAGSLSEADAQAFDACLKDQRRLDPNMWK